jgi:LPS sulfotransferase NodH
VATVLPEIDVEKVKRWCRDRVPDQVKDEVRLEVTTRGKSVSIHECRPVWRGAPGEWTRMAIAQLRYEGDGTWTLYCADRNDRWTPYFDLDAHQPVDVIIDELENDPTCLFWG